MRERGCTLGISRKIMLLHTGMD
jgi:hypothetical protein